MVTLRLLAAAVLGVAALAQEALAHSTQRNPITYVSLVEDAVLHTPSQRCHALSNFELTFTLHDRQQKIRLSLEPNHDILHDSLLVHYLAEDGSLRSVEAIDRAEHKVFRGNAFIRREGHTEWTNVGWARITVHRDGQEPIFEGAFRVDGDHHHIQTGANYRLLKHKEDPDVKIDQSPDDTMVVWRDSDVLATYFDPQELKRDVHGRTTCESDSLSFNAQYDGLNIEDALRSVDQGSLLGRQIDGTTGNNGAGVNLVTTISNTNGCPTTRKVALVGIATDCTYTRDFNSTQAARANIIQQINAASEVYESTFNISLGIQNLTISDARCPGQASSNAPWNVDCSPDVDITARLNLFSAWRGLSNDNNAYWTLLSTCNTDAAVGLAWLGQACQTGSQPTNANGGSNETIASANVVIRTTTEWQVIAHETGHTFGAVHDCTSASCNNGDASTSKCCPLSADQCDADGQFIMNPSTGTGIAAFSPCSIGNICSGLLRNQVKSNCLTNNRDVNTITGSQCGNGIVESGEDCDCGGEQGCGNNSCCDAKTCKFTTGSVCDPSNEDCCTGQCQFSAGGTVCRASTGFCDPEETCSGTSPMCPENVHKNDGSSCGESGQGLQCASGQCTSRNLQCRTLIGARTSTNETYACSSQGCLLSCSSPQFGPDMCVTMNQNFLDGTTCQGGGKCDNGVCRGASIGNEIVAWINDNKNIVIPVACVIGGLLLLAILCCCVSCVRKRTKRSKARIPKPPPPANSWQNYGGNWGSRGNIPTPPPASHRRGQPPQYVQHPPDPSDRWQPQRSMSMRYA